MNAVEKAVQAIGNQAETARQLDVTYQFVSIWVKEGKVPPGQAVKLSRLSGVDYTELAPDFDWPPKG